MPSVAQATRNMVHAKAEAIRSRAAITHATTKGTLVINAKVAVASQADAAVTVAHKAERVAQAALEAAAAAANDAKTDAAESRLQHATAAVNVAEKRAQVAHTELTRAKQAAAVTIRQARERAAAAATAVTAATLDQAAARGAEKQKKLGRRAARKKPERRATTTKTAELSPVELNKIKRTLQDKSATNKRRRNLTLQKLHAAAAVVKIRSPKQHVKAVVHGKPVVAAHDPHATSAAHKARVAQAARAQAEAARARARAMQAQQHIVDVKAQARGMVTAKLTVARSADAAVTHAQEAEASTLAKARAAKAAGDATAAARAAARQGQAHADVLAATAYAKTAHAALTDAKQDAAEAVQEAVEDAQAVNTLATAAAAQAQHAAAAVHGKATVGVHGKVSVGLHGKVDFGLHGKVTVGVHGKATTAVNKVLHKRAESTWGQAVARAAQSVQGADVTVHTSASGLPQITVHLADQQVAKHKQAARRKGTKRGKTASFKKHCSSRVALNRCLPTVGKGTATTKRVALTTVKRCFAAHAKAKQACIAQTKQAAARKRAAAHKAELKKTRAEVKKAQAALKHAVAPAAKASARVGLTLALKAVALGEERHAHTLSVAAEQALVQADKAHRAETIAVNHVTSLVQAHAPPAEVQQARAAQVAAHTVTIKAELVVHQTHQAAQKAKAAATQARTRVAVHTGQTSVGSALLPLEDSLAADDYLHADQETFQDHKQVHEAARRRHERERQAAEKRRRAKFQKVPPQTASTTTTNNNNNCSFLHFTSPMCALTPSCF